jgi:acyl-CoA synthetase (AMP-forming)/AMP-acid ligase II
MAGYYDDASETDRVLAGGWLRTGDLGRMDEHGCLYYVDRTKNMIKVSGHNVSTTEVEEVICEHPAVAEAAVVPVPHPTRGKMGKAFVVLEAGATLTAGEVIDDCAAHPAKFKLPGEVDFLDALPRTSIGKLAKAELLDREVRRRPGGAG